MPVLVLAGVETETIQRAVLHTVERHVVEGDREGLKCLETLGHDVADFPLRVRSEAAEEYPPPFGDIGREDDLALYRVRQDESSVLVDLAIRRDKPLFLGLTQIVLQNLVELGFRCNHLLEFALEPRLPDEWRYDVAEVALVAVALMAVPPGSRTVMKLMPSCWRWLQSLSFCVPFPAPSPPSRPPKNPLITFIPSW